MRYAIDAHAIGRRLTGNEVYVRNLLANLVLVDPGSEFVAYFSTGGSNGWAPTCVARKTVASNAFARLGFDLGRSLRRDRPSLLHVQYTAPLWCPVPVVVTVHDVSFFDHPEYYPFCRAEQLRLTVSRTVHRAAKIVTGSEFSRAAIARAYGLDPESIAVVPCAASPFFRSVDRMKATAEVSARFGFTGPFLLTVGDLRPRKNHVGLIRAFAEMTSRLPHLRHSLVLVGQDTWFSRNIREAVRTSHVSDRVHFTGFVTDEELLLLYNACELFVFPSLYEGFGLPLLEAMACGRAVACSNVSSCPEVADKAAVFFDPNSTDEMARAMSDLLLDHELRARMERLGLIRVAHFSWRKTAEMTLNIYRDVTRRAAARSSRLKPAAAASRRRLDFVGNHSQEGHVPASSSPESPAGSFSH